MRVGAGLAPPGRAAAIFSFFGRGKPRPYGMGKYPNMWKKGDEDVPARRHYMNGRWRYSTSSVICSANATLRRCPNL